MPPVPAPPTRRALLVLASLLAVAACSSGSATHAGSAATGATSTSTTGTSRVPPTTRAVTTSATTGTTAVPLPKIGFPTPRAALEHLLGALTSNDRIGAAQGADPAAVFAMFALQGKALYIYQCDTAEFATSGCTIRAADGTGQVNMAKRPEGWVVSTIYWAPA